MEDDETPSMENYMMKRQLEMGEDPFEEDVNDSNEDSDASVDADAMDIDDYGEGEEEQEQEQEQDDEDEDEASEYEGEDVDLDEDHDQEDFGDRGNLIIGEFDEEPELPDHGIEEERFEYADDCYEAIGEDGEIIVKQIPTTEADMDAGPQVEYKALDNKGNIVNKKTGAKNMGLSETEYDRRLGNIRSGLDARIQNIRLSYYRDANVNNSTRDEDIQSHEVVHASTEHMLDFGRECRYAITIGKRGEFSQNEEENQKKIEAEIPGWWFENTDNGQIRHYPDGPTYFNEDTECYEVKVRSRHPKSKKRKGSKKTKGNEKSSS